MKPMLFSVLTPFLAIALLGCGGAQQAAPAEPQQAAAPAAAGDGAKPAATTTTKLGPNVTPDGVVFNFKHGGKPRRLYLSGTFNNWNPADNDYLMKDEDGDGIYSITVKLKPGTYQYKFVADGTWIKDPEAPSSTPVGFGGQNGKFDVQ